MKQRVRILAEAAVIMVCPILLAISLKKVDTKSKTSGSLVLGYISPVTACTLEAGLLSFLCLCFCSSNLVTRDAADLLFRASKVLVLLCGPLLMGLASSILLLIHMTNVLVYLVAPCILTLLIIWRMYTTWGNGHGHDAELYTGRGDELETWIDFSASLTALLFLGLEGLALEGQSSSPGTAGSPVADSVGLSFGACLGGICVMLLATVPPMIRDDAQSGDMCDVIGYLNLLLAMAFAANVYYIAFALLGPWACLVFIHPLVSLLVWVFAECCDEDDDHDDGGTAVVQAVKPASMELTKVTFTGFLAVSVPALGDTSVSVCTRAFVLITGEAVVAGLLWRLLTHRTPASSARVKAADLASFSTHLSLLVAVIPFAIMASEALK